MILSAQTIRHHCEWVPPHKFSGQPMIAPFFERTVRNGKSFGLSSAGYDIRVEKFRRYESIEDHVRLQAGDFVLASSMERIKMPNNIIAFVKDKSSWAREGLSVFNTVIEPGWEGYLTLELAFKRPAYHVVIREGDPIAQLVFQYLDFPTEQPYKGKYQNQAAEPVEAIKESTNPGYLEDNHEVVPGPILDEMDNELAGRKG